jgi:hypothetical protein
MDRSREWPLKFPAAQVAENAQGTRSSPRAFFFCRVPAACSRSGRNATKNCHEKAQETQKRPEKNTARRAHDPSFPPSFASFVPSRGTAAFLLIAT